MKCITLTQPYATLITLGAKKIETRSWSTSYRGPLAIHAAKGLGSVGGMRGLQDLAGFGHFFFALADITQHTPQLGIAPAICGALPRGAIVATCRLVGCVDTERLMRAQGWYVAGQHWPLTDQERAFGDYSLGRFAWLLADIKALPEPIPCRGALGLWNYEGAI